MNLEELKANAKRDCKLGSELDDEAARLSQKKAQWSEWLSMFAVSYKKADWKLKKIQAARFEYYFSDYHITLTPGDIRNIYLPGDAKVIEALKEVELSKQKIELCDRTMKTLVSMGFDIKNIIEYRKFMSGIL